MRRLIEKMVRLRNPRFKFNKDVGSYEFIQFVYSQARCMLRGSSLLLTGRSPKGMLLERGVRFFNLRRITWGRYLRIGENVYMSASGEGIRFGNNVGIGAYSRIIVSTSLTAPGRYIRIGNNVGIGEFSYLGGAGGLEIGDDCIIGQYLSCHPENHIHDDIEELIRNQGVTREGISVGKNCWIGSKVTLLDGVRLGEGCVIGAGAVVTRSFPAYSVIGGVPAKILRRRDAMPGNAVLQSEKNQYL